MDEEHSKWALQEIDGKARALMFGVTGSGSGSDGRLRVFNHDHEHPPQWVNSVKRGS